MHPHTRMQCTHSNIDPFEIISYVTSLAFPVEAPRGASLFYFSALKASSKPFFFLSAEILSPPALCFNSEKQAPTHLSVFPYLQPHCVLQDLSTTQVTWMGGVEVCSEAGCGGSERGLQYQ